MNRPHFLVRPNHSGRRGRRAEPQFLERQPQFHHPLLQRYRGPGRGRWYDVGRFQSTATGPRSGSTVSKALPLPKSNPQRKSLPAPGPPKEDPIPIANNVSPLPLWQRLGPLTRAAEGYARAQRNRPYVTQVCSSLVIALCADLAVQRMSAWVAEKEVVETQAENQADIPTPASTTPIYSYDSRRTARSLIIGAIFAIPTYRWFIFLSRNFNYSSHFVSLTVKIVVNQLCYTPVFNSYFFGMQALLAGDTPQEAFDRVRRTVPISFVNALKLWPAVTAFSFTFVPMEYRSVFSGVIAVGWQTYLMYLNRTAEVAEAARPKQTLVGPIA